MISLGRQLCTRRPGHLRASVAELCTPNNLNAFTIATCVGGKYVHAGTSKLRLRYWITILDYDTRLRYWITILDYDTGVRYWSTILEYDTGVRYWIVLHQRTVSRRPHLHTHAQNFSECQMTWKLND